MHVQHMAMCMPWLCCRAHDSTSGILQVSCPISQPWVVRCEQFAVYTVQVHGSILAALNHPKLLHTSVLAQAHVQGLLLPA
jgi:hypothetical protein